ncbi:XRE family transcriptional regulator [Paractinoplanes abujensis]|uniref:Putative ATPase/DNA-binding XRE family transcriptional regulator n=1 Tax=Paractinoplanes abujensis TaxID=882441 RepID=A0A7W7G6J7_9ACTN|nr:helix-turn-helix domain-containing protein [Actinoplanes abujensis]MBB4696056.1 putative ATPase/DNA-binding XRE family transcriptional regulator [Actinoplanes abujensis]GID22044.1 XRE family transcriptional regulator [Actinoplanes abujensis]
MVANNGGESAPEQGGFDAVLRRERLRARLTQDELAARAAVGVRTVRDLERGRASRPQRTTVELLAAALGLGGADREAFLAAARGQSTEDPLPPTGFLRVLPTTELIGRDDDLEEMTAQLAAPDGPRGITLVGLAGVGKTSLAFVAAHRAATAYPGGVAGIVVTDGCTVGEMLGSIAAEFGVGRADDLPAVFAGRAALVLVDAVERSPDATAEMLSQLLERLPTVRFLATGRHPIGLPAERVWPLAPLLAPPPETDGPLADVAAAYPAVALFLERLGQVRRDEPEPGEVAPLAALVRRLGGLPLAIELAAARGRVLTIPEILDRYGDRVLDLDRPGSSEPLVSLRDAVAASYRLLNSEEQRELRRLAMFRYRWSIGLAEQLIDNPRADVVHLLDRLLELGLLSVRGRRTFRFRLLDVVRDYAAERAAAEGELDEGRRRHAQVMAGLAHEIWPDLTGARLPEAAARLDDVAGDFGTALAYAAGEDPHTALRLAAALPRWWRFRGRDVTGRQWLRRLLDDPRTADADPAVRAWARIGMAQLAREHGGSADEIESAAAALAEFERLDEVAGQLTAHAQLAGLWMNAGDFDRARGHGEAALVLARRGGRARDLAVAENNLVWHEIRQGNLAAARDRLAIVEEQARRSGEKRLRVLAQANLAEVQRLDGRTGEAARLGRRAMTELIKLGDPGHQRRLLATIGLALAEAGRTDEAAAVLEQLAPEEDDDTQDGPAAVVEAAVALSRGEPKRAAECFARAADAYDGAHDPRDVVEALVGLIASTPDEDERESAVRRLRELCRSGGITLLPRERDRLGPRLLTQVLES